MRCFVALRPSEEAVDHLDAFLDVRRSAAPWRWTPAEQFHVTLAFMAEVPEHKLDDLHERLERAAAKRTAFSTRVTGGGAFPSPHKARVLWAGLDLAAADPASGVDRAEELRRLATGCRAAANKAGAAVDGQRFKPHVTIARLGHPGETSDWVKLFDAYAGPQFAVDEIELVASHLGEGPRNRPRHEVLGTYALGR